MESTFHYPNVPVNYVKSFFLVGGDLSKWNLGYMYSQSSWLMFYKINSSKTLTYRKSKKYYTSVHFDETACLSHNILVTQLSGLLRASFTLNCFKQNSSLENFIYNIWYLPSRISKVVTVIYSLGYQYFSLPSWYM